jgi:hypothetical protein
MGHCYIYQSNLPEARCHICETASEHRGEQGGGQATSATTANISYST